MASHLASNRQFHSVQDYLVEHERRVRVKGRVRAESARPTATCVHLTHHDACTQSKHRLQIAPRLSPPTEVPPSCPSPHHAIQSTVDGGMPPTQAIDSQRDERRLRQEGGVGFEDDSFSLASTLVTAVPLPGVGTASLDGSLALPASAGSQMHGAYYSSEAPPPHFDSAARDSAADEAVSRGQQRGSSATAEPEGDETTWQMATRVANSHPAVRAVARGLRRMRRHAYKRWCEQFPELSGQNAREKEQVRRAGGWLGPGGGWGGVGWGGGLASLQTLDLNPSVLIFFNLPPRSGSARKSDGGM